MAILLYAFAGLYTPNPNRKLGTDITGIMFASTGALGVIGLYVMFSGIAFDSRFLIAATWAVGMVTVIFGRMLIIGFRTVLYRSGIGLRRLVLVGKGEHAETLASLLSERTSLGYDVVGQFSSYSKNAAKSILSKKPDEIILTDPKGQTDNAVDLIEFCNQHHIVFKYSADTFATYSTNMTVSPLAGMPIVELRRTPLEGWGKVAKRLFDIGLSLVVIIITSPVMLLTAIAILIETGAPVIYRNERVGLRGERFFTLKFRSMHQQYSTGAQFGKAGKEAEKFEAKLIKKQSARRGPIYKIADDPRVTKVGRFIRRWSIDELPQFFNVLGGSMSIVGPRPHQPREVAQYEREYKTLFSIKPGITGLAQISGRSDLSFEEEVKLDIFYIERWTLLLDLIIFIKTPFILFKKRKVV